MLVDAVGVRPGQAVLDVGCGTGIVARTAADRIDGRGVVVGVDVNEAMLAVARRVRPDVDWQQGDATGLQFPDQSFDAVLCQMALLFFPDRGKALEEMGRVTREGGAVGVVVPAGLAVQPAYGPFVDVAVRHAGPAALSLLGTYWACGDLEQLVRLVASAGLDVVETRTRLGTARFDSVDDLVATEVEGSPLRDRINDEEYRRIRDDARAVLRPFQTVTGTVNAPLRAHLVVARRTC